MEISPGLQELLFFSMCGLPFLGISLALSGYADARSIKRWAIACFIAPFLLYAIYEAGMPTRMDIRLDLLLIYPILVLSLIGLIWSSIKLSVENDG
jgi:hypothetical protein